MPRIEGYNWGEEKKKTTREVLTEVITETGFVIPKEARLPDLRIGGKSPAKLERALDKGKFAVAEVARDMLRDPNFSTSRRKHTVSLVKLTLEEMQLPDATIQQVHARANEMGLDLCPAEVGPHLRLASRSGEWLHIGMEPINKFAFLVCSGLASSGPYNNTWLEAYQVFPAESGDRYKLRTSDRQKFVFALRKPSK
jgi:hypothetical protein